MTTLLEAPSTALDRAYQAAEARLGRQLTPAERHVDMIQLDRDLNAGKERLTAAIEKEKIRSLRAALDGKPDWRPRVTPEMERVMTQLHETGRRHAERELASMGYPMRMFAEDEDARARDRAREALTRALAQGQPAQRIATLRKALNQLLQAMGLRIRRTVKQGIPGLQAGLSAIARRKIEREMERRVPGSRDIAGRIVSGALYGGLGDVFDRVKDLIPCWEYSAIMDNATCGPCRSADGTRFNTWAEAMRVLPNGGPNPLCRGDGRCRCRLVPCPPGTDPDSGEPEPLIEHPTRLIMRPPELDELRFFRDENPSWAPGAREPSDALIDKIIEGERIIDSAVRVRTTRPIRSFPVVEIDAHPREGGGETVGSFGRFESGRPGAMLLSEPQALGTILHEYGHFLDSVLYNGDGTFAPGTEHDKGYGSGRALLSGAGPHREAFQKLFTAIMATEPMERLVAMRLNPESQSFLTDVGVVYADMEYLDYLLRPHETFARALAAALTEKSGNSSLQFGQDQLGSERAVYPQGWLKRDRIKLVEAFEEFFRSVGWQP